MPSTVAWKKAKASFQLADFFFAFLRICLNEDVLEGKIAWEFNFSLQGMR